jgi:hypothetical protein
MPEINTEIFPTAHRFFKNGGLMFIDLFIHFRRNACQYRMKLQTLVLLIYAFSLFYSTNGISQLELFPGLKCSYNYDLEVHTHRGERSTKELNFKINVQVCYISFYPKEINEQTSLFKIRIDMHRYSG